MLGLHDPTTTPVMGESLETFFRRTVDCWAKSVGASLAAGDILSGKQLRRRAFDLARTRYEELWPLLEEMNELEAEQARLESQVTKFKGAPGGGGGAGAGKKGGAAPSGGKGGRDDKKKGSKK